MLPACRTGGEGFAIPTFDLAPSDVEGFIEELWEFQSAFHDCFARSEPRAHFFDYILQRHLHVLTKFAHIESRFCGRKGRGEAVFEVAVNSCVKSTCSLSVAVGVSGRFSGT